MSDPFKSEGNPFPILLRVVLGVDVDEGEELETGIVYDGPEDGVNSRSAGLLTLRRRAEGGVVIISPEGNGNPSASRRCIGVTALLAPSPAPFLSRKVSFSVCAICFLWWLKEWRRRVNVRRLSVFRACWLK